MIACGWIRFATAICLTARSTTYEVYALRD
jgi:hypothetical protein